MQLPAAHITLLEPAKTEFSMAVKHSPFTIGRQEGIDAVLPVGSASGVSKHHLTITFENGQFFARDDKSTYGTTLDGETLVKGQPSPLHDGAVIGLGPKVKIKFQLASKGGPTPDGRRRQTE
jgi:pSer/pThr/pTyr-binding forkhead associated (FHA) protein